jgi:hypothetical protein
MKEVILLMLINLEIKSLIDKIQKKKYFQKIILN